MSDEVFKFKYQGIPRTNSYMIEMTVDSILSSPSLKAHIEHMIAQAVRTAVMEQYSEIQTVVFDLVRSQDIKDYVFGKIRNEVDKAIKENVGEMFGKVKL